MGALARSSAFAGLIGLAPLIAPSDNTDLTTAKTGLGVTAGWDAGRVLGASDVDALQRTRDAVGRVPQVPDQLPDWLKIAGAGMLLLSAAATGVVAVKAAPQV